MNPVISNNFSVTALKQGEDAFVCDLTNQMTSVPVDANNKVTFATEVKTTARIIKGAGVISSGVTPPTASSLQIAGVTPTITNTNGEVEFKWSFAKGTEVSDARYVRTLILTYDGHTYKADFTLLTDKTGAIYDLLPSMTEVPFVRDENYNLIPASMTIYCGYTKNQDGTITTFNGKIASHLANIDNRYYIYYRLEKADGTFGSWTAVTTSGISIANSSTDAAIEFIMSSASTVAAITDSNIIDRENVPIVRQSERGFGIVCSVQRDNFTEAQWNTDPGYGVIGHQETWSDTSSLRNGARKGDLFTVVGQATDSRNGHTATYRCTNASGNLQGICIAHAISKAGEHAIRVDLDNEVDIVATNSDGKVRFARSIVTKATLFEGPKPIKSGISITASGIRISPVTNGNLNYLEPTVSAVDSTTGEITITWAFTTAMTLTQDAYEITIPITYNNVTYNAVFTLKRVDASVIYQLAPTLSSISFARTSATDNTLTPEKRTLGMNILKTDGSSSSSLSVADSGLTVRYSTSSMPGSKTAGTAWPADGVEIASSTTATNVFVALFNSDGVLFDRESIPIVKDGVNGSSPIYADIDNEMDAVACDVDGKATSEQAVSTNVSIFKGKDKQTISGISCKIGSTTLAASYGSSTSSVSYYYKVSVNTSTGNVQVTVRKDTVITTPVEVIITVSATIDGASVSRDLTLTINGMRPGANGQHAIIYNLMPSVSEISVGRTDAGGYNPSTFALTCGYKKSVGGSITSVSDATSKIDDAYYIYYRRRTRSSQEWETTYYRYSYYRNYASYSLSAFDVATYDCIEFIICSATSTSFAVSELGNYTVIDKETVPVVADGTKGNPGGIGPDGNGISSDDFYYCLTATIEPPQTTYLINAYDWYLQGSTGCPTAPTQKKPYLWQCEYIQYTTNTSLNKKVLKLVNVYNLEPQPQLLEQTAFDSEDVMTAWNKKNGEVVPQARGIYNAYGCFPTSASEVNMLQQLVFAAGSISKIVANEWYTLSFYSRTRRVVNLTDYHYGFGFQDIYLKAGRYKLQINGRCSTAARTNSSGYYAYLDAYMWYSPKDGQTEDWSKVANANLLSTVDTTVTSGELVVSSSGWYRIGFYAQDNRSGEREFASDKTVTVNWWRVISVNDNSQIYTFLYPSALNTGNSHFVDGVVKSGCPEDGGIKWELDNDDANADSGGWTRHSVTFKTKSSISVTDQNVLWRIYNTYIEICQPKLEQSVMPTDWCEHEDDSSMECTHNPKGDWDPTSTYYYCRGSRDVVRAQKSSLTQQKTWFRLKKRTNYLGYKSSTQPYADTAHWEKADFLSFLATQLLLADEAIVNNLVAAIIRTGTKGMPHIEAKGSTFQIYSFGEYPIIELERGVFNGEAVGVLRFRDENTGAVYYDLGPEGIKSTVSQDEQIRAIENYMEIGTPDNSDSLMDDAYSYYANIFNSYNAAHSVTTIYQYEAKIAANLFDKGDYCASVEDAKAANMKWFRNRAYSGANGSKFISDIPLMTGLLCYSWHKQTNGGLYRVVRPSQLDAPEIYEGRAVPTDYDTNLDDTNLEVNFMTDYNGDYVDPIYWRQVFLVVEGQIVDNITVYINESKINSL